ncbi:MAG: SRPBCC family protein [Kineosporiaceae bacterium]|jgi:uncharacterized protein YndB with AHSA1/START domain
MTHTMIFQVDTDATLDATHAALTTADGVTAWWTDTATVPETVGGHLELTFPGVPLPFDLILDENGPGRVTWRAGGFPPPWQGTTCTWDLADNPDADGTRLRFEHSGWEESNPAIGSVTFGWGQILGRLKHYLDTGTPDPFFINDAA